MGIKKWLFFSVFLCLPEPADAADKPVLAIFEVEARKVKIDASDLAGLRDMIATQLTANGRFKVVPQAQIRQAMAAKKQESYQACYAESCQIEIGNELAATHTLSSVLQGYGKKCVLSLTLYELREAASVGAAQSEGSCQVDALPTLARDAAMGLGGPQGAPPPPPPGTDYAALAAQADAEQKAAEEQTAALEGQRAERQKRLETAWLSVERVVFTRTMDKSKRAKVVDQFLKDFAEDNPRRAWAQQILLALRAGTEPTGAELRWKKSKLINLEFTETEVTVEQYAACVQTGACSADGLGTLSYCNWGGSARGSHPLNCVDWRQADIFCRAMGGRLPTDQEWYAEASGGGKKRYPWGNGPLSCDYTIWGDGDKPDGCGFKGTAPVCSRIKGLSASGLCDMSGNLWEWTADVQNDERPLRGGSWVSASAESQGAGARLAFLATDRFNDAGFRCVRPVQ